MRFRKRLSARRWLLVATLAGIPLVGLSFGLGSWLTKRTFEGHLAANEARLTALRDEMTLSLLLMQQDQASRSSSQLHEMKRQIQSEMGLLPLSLVRERRESFVELHAVDGDGRTSYGTAGYLGRGYFVTVKHGVIALGRPGGPRISAITVRHRGKDVRARIVDSGDADVEVHAGDWAIIKVDEELDLPPLKVDVTYQYQFADPIFRLGNDYSKGILLSTGYIGQRTSNGLVTCLTDGHPGASGGGVLNQQGDLVGIPVGRMAGDYRFSFILPLRPEMFAKVPGFETVAGIDVRNESVPDAGLAAAGTRVAPTTASP